MRIFASVSMHFNPDRFLHLGNPGNSRKLGEDLETWKQKPARLDNIRLASRPWVG